MQSTARSHPALEISRAAGAAPETVRYTVSARGRAVGHIELLEARDTPDVEFFIRAYLRRHPSPIVRAAKVLLSLIR